MKYEIRDLFVSADQPDEQKITINYADKKNESYIPAKTGWDDPTETKPNLSELSKWVETYGDNRMAVLCPSTFSTGRRTTKDSKARCYWLGLDFDAPNSIKMKDLIPELSDFAGFYYTTKNHQKDKGGITCDRYRVFMSYSRPVTREENRTIHKVLAELIGHDSSCGDISRIYNPSVKECIKGDLDGSDAVDVDNLLDIASEMGVDAFNPSLSLPLAGTNCKEIDWNSGSINQRLLRRLNSIWGKRYRVNCENQTDDTYRAVWALINESFVVTAELPDIYATLLKIEHIEYWAYRKRETQNLPETILKAFEDKLAEVQATQFTPLLKSNPIDMSQIEDVSKEYQNQFKKLGFNANPDQHGTHKIINHYSGKGRYILNIGCGLMKSVSACVYASIKREPPTWLICENHKAITAMIDRLEVLGVDREDVGYIAGFSDTICKQPSRISKIPKHENKYRKIYNPMRSPCNGCPSFFECPITNRIFEVRFQKAVQKRIVIMTHKMFTLKFQPWDLNVQKYQINPDVQIIIDEQLRRWQTGEYTESEIKRTLGMANESDAIMDAIDNACSDQQRKGNRTVSGVGRINQSIGITNKSQAIKNVAGCDISDDEMQKAIKIITLLSAESRRYVMRSDYKYQIISDKLNWDFPKNTLILDGSARYTQVDFDGFEMLDYVIPSVKGLTVHIVKGNPTQKRIKRTYEKYKKIASDIKNDTQSQKVVWAKNKGDETFVANSPDDLIANRGTDTRGSNQFLNGDMMIVVMSLFTTVSDYALRAALSENEEIPFDAIWKKQKYKFTPNMSSNGWLSPSLQQSYIRQVIDELYQCIMRIGVRQYDNKEYHVVCMLPDQISIEELKGRLPDCKVNLIGFDKKTLNKKQRETQTFENVSASQTKQTHKTYRKALEK